MRIILELHHQSLIETPESNFVLFSVPTKKISEEEKQIAYAEQNPEDVMN